VFDAPWESRAFGAAVAMSQSGMYRFDELRDLLIAKSDSRNGRIAAMTMGGAITRIG